MKTTENNLPIDELRKYGIINKNNNDFNEKLSNIDIQSFKKGGILIAEDDKNQLTFQLKDNNEKLEVNIYNKDIINHKDLSTAELYEISSKKDNLYKVMADFGVITNIGQANFRGNSKNEKTHFVEIENERGKTTFYGNDLEEKLKGFEKGDKIQINNSGIIKSSIELDTENGLKTFSKYDNLFEIKKFEEKEKNFQSKLFEYDSKTKTIKDIDTTKLEVHSINGIKLNQKQLEQLKKGKEVKLDEELSVQISPKSNNTAKLKANAKNLFLLSVALDGGMSFMLLKGVEKLNRMFKEKKEQNEHSRYKTELEKMKSFLQSKAEQYPENKKIINDLNVVGKELANVKMGLNNNRKPDKADDSVRLKVNDYDMYEDANRKKEQELKEDQEESKNKGRSR